MPNTPAGQPYSEREASALGTAPDPIIARRIGRSVESVERARRDRGIPSHREQRSATRWARFDAMLGAMPDLALAVKMGISDVAVRKRREKLGIAAFKRT